MYILKSSIVVLILSGFIFSQNPRIIFQTSWGTSENQIGLREAPDERYAAQSFRVTNDTISILDGQNQQLKLFKTNQIISTFPVPKVARDFISIGSDSYTIVSDRFMQRTSLTKQETVANIDRGMVIQHVQTLPFSEPVIAYSDGQVQAIGPNQTIEQNPVQLHKLNKSEARVRIDLKDLQTDFTIDFPDNNLASIRFVGVDAQNHLFIHLEFFSSQVPLRVERQVCVYNLRGEQLLTYGIAINNYALIFRDLFVDSKGNLYQMLQSPQGLKILKWDWPDPENDLPMKLDAPQYERQPDYKSSIQIPESTHVKKSTVLPDVTPEIALAIADTYDKLTWTCSADNLTTGTITDAYGNHVQTPDWLYVGNVQRVPYKWGGFNTIDGFLAGISAGKYAGDRATDSVSPEAVGVDCSGFVSRCWTLPSHYSTRMMDDAIAQPYDSWEQAGPGDVCHKPGHVRLIVSHRPDGSIDMVEAAGFNWRVSYTNYTYSQITAYTPRYYIYMQGVPGNIPQPTLQYLTFEDQAELSWKVSESNTLSGFSIKSSTDAQFFDEEDFVPADSAQFHQAIEDTQVIYLKMTSISAENQEESLQSDIYGLYRNDKRAKILIVDGFDRISESSGSWNHVYHDFAAVHGRTLESLNLPFVTAANEAILDSSIQLSDYEAVIWFCGDESTADETFSTAEQNLIAAYLTGGGQLFVSGSEIGWDLGYKGSTEDKAFYKNYLKAAYAQDDANSYVANGNSGSPFDSLSIHYDDGSHGVYPEDYPDTINPSSGSSVALRYGNSQIAAIYYEGTFGTGIDTGRVFYLAFPFETIYQENERLALMEKITQFFDISIYNINIVIEPVLPTYSQLKLFGNYPNPFNGQTHIRFYLPAPGKVKISVYNIQGQLLFREKMYADEWGEIQIPISANNWASGIYAYLIESETMLGREQASGKLVLVK